MSASYAVTSVIGGAQVESRCGIIPTRRIQELDAKTADRHLVGGSREGPETNDFAGDSAAGPAVHIPWTACWDVCASADVATFTAAAKNTDKAKDTRANERGIMA
jgi:hypothetical protein